MKLLEYAPQPTPDYKPAFPELLKAHLEILGWSTADLVSATELKSKQAYRWFSGAIQPKRESVCKIGFLLAQEYDRNAASGNPVSSKYLGFANADELLRELLESAGYDIWPSEGNQVWNRLAALDRPSLIFGCEDSRLNGERRPATDYPSSSEDSVGRICDHLNVTSVQKYIPRSAQRLALLGREVDVIQLSDTPHNRMRFALSNPIDPKEQVPIALVIQKQMLQGNGRANGTLDSILSCPFNLGRVTGDAAYAVALELQGYEQIEQLATYPESLQWLLDEHTGLPRVLSVESTIGHEFVNGQSEALHLVESPNIGALSYRRCFATHPDERRLCDAINYALDAGKRWEALDLPTSRH